MTFVFSDGKKMVVNNARKPEHDEDGDVRRNKKKKNHSMEKLPCIIYILLYLTRRRAFPGKSEWGKHPTTPSDQWTVAEGGDDSML